MRRILPLITALILAAPALAATSPPGVNIRWDLCYGDGGAANKVFACDTNSGSERLVLSFVLDSPMVGVSGNEIIVDLAATAATLPAWWTFKNVGTCRIAALGLNTVATPGPACIDWAINGPATAGIGAYDIGVRGPNTARIKIANAVQASALADLSAGQEYFSMNVTITNQKTVGTSSCAGCDVPLCIVYQSLKLTTQVAANDRRFINGANSQDSQIATWQHAHITGVTLSCGMTGCDHNFGCAAFDPTSARNSTWGAVKSLYR